MTELQQSIASSIFDIAMAIVFIMIVSRFVPERRKSGWRACAIGILLAACGYSVAAAVNFQLGMSMMLLGFILNVIGIIISAGRRK